MKWIWNLIYTYVSFIFSSSFFFCHFDPVWFETLRHYIYGNIISPDKRRKWKWVLSRYINERFFALCILHIWNGLYEYKYAFSFDLKEMCFRFMDRMKACWASWVPAHFVYIHKTYRIGWRWCLLSSHREITANLMFGSGEWSPGLFLSFSINCVIEYCALLHRCWLAPNLGMAKTGTPAK